MDRFRNSAEAIFPLRRWSVAHAAVRCGRPDAAAPASESIDSGPKRPRILIHSERQGPEAAVIDTNQRAFVPPVTAQADAAAAPQSFRRCSTPSSRQASLGASDGIDVIANNCRTCFHA
jgi:hypothetical protein